jgi:hypothetical protein
MGNTNGTFSNVYAVAGNQSVEVNWSYSSGTNIFKEFGVYVDGVLAGYDDGSPFVVTNLTPGQTYSFYVKAFNVGGSTDSATVTATPYGPPGAPTGLTATPSNTQISLAWTAPTSTGGFPIQSYNVYRNNVFLVNTSTTSFTNTGLTNGTSYSYYVIAYNGVLFGAASNTVSATPFTNPGAPTGLSATPGNTQVSLSWTAPASNGGSAITTYRIYRNNAFLGQTANGTTTTFTNTGLTNGTSYSYFVRAFNSLESANSNTVSSTPFTNPSAPTGLSATPGNTQVTLSWTASSSNGGSVITQYRIYRNNVLIGNTSTGLVTTFINTGLTNGTSYSYFVRAFNSLESTNSNTVSSTPFTNPGAPTGLSATPGNTQVVLSWTAPVSNGGSAISQYRIYRNNVFIGQTPNGTTTTFTNTGLANGTTYSFYVTAFNNLEGPGSNTVSTTPFTNPGAPTSLSAISGNQQVTLSWTASEPNGSAIQYYRIYRNSIFLTNTPDASTTFIVLGLTNGTSYSFYVTAFNNLEGGASNTANSIPIGPPPTLASPTVVIQSNQNTLAYSEYGYQWTGLGSQVFGTRGNHAAWNGIMWVAVGNGINSIAYSSNGINWTGVGSTLFSEGLRVAWNGSYFLAGGTGGATTLARSTDGITWTAVASPPFTTKTSGLAWNGLRWVATGSGGRTLAYSEDSITWNTGIGFGSTIFSVEGKSVLWGGAYFVAAGEGANNTLAFSTDGIFWGGAGNSIFSVYGSDIAWNGSRYVATGSGATHTLAYSDDGISWTGLGKTIFTTTGRGVAYNGRMFIGSGEGTNTIAISGNGIDWTKVAETDLFTSFGSGIGAVSGLGSVVPNKEIILSDITNVPPVVVDNGQRNQLDIVSDKYGNSSLVNISVTVKTQDVPTL